MNPDPASPDDSPAAVRLTVRRAMFNPGRPVDWREAPDAVAAEAPLTLRVEGRVVAVVMRTPGYDRELAAGFLLTEGVILTVRDIFEISVCPSLHRPDVSGPACDPGDSVDVLLANKSAFDPDKLTRHVFTSSSCGICSKTGLTMAIPPDRILTPDSGPAIPAAALAALPEKLRAAQPVFARTGGLHACAWWPLESVRSTTGLEPVPLLFEDVGRHNALDKLLGHALLTGQSLDAGVLVLSGRISFELVQKAHAARIPLIAAVGAPSSLAVDFAAAAGITLCGFVREDRLNVYTHPSRLA